MADQTSSIDELNEYIKRFAVSSRDLGDSFEYAEKAADKLKREFTAGSRDVSKLRSSLQSSAEAIKEAERKYSDAQKKYNEATDSATKEQYRNQLAEARTRKENLAALHSVLDREVTARIESIESSKVAFDALKTSAKTFKSTIGSVLGGLQGGAGAVGVAGGALMGGIAAAGSAGAAAGSALSGLGAATAGLGGKFKWLGIGLDGFGKLLGATSKGLSEAAQAVIPYFIKEVERTLSSFQTMSASGAMFADGMSGMRRAAGESGLSLETFSKIVSTNSESLGAAGLGITGAANKFAAVSRVMIQSGIQQQILNLGYSLEEYGSLTADVLADLNRTGQLRKVSDTEIAAVTGQYAKDLRLISSITGEDARKKLAAVRAENDILAFQQKMASLAPQQQQAITDAMGTLTALEAKNLRERIVFGSVINTEGAVLESSIPAIKEKMDRMYQLYNQGALNAESAAKVTADTSERVRKGVIGATALGQAGMGAGGLTGAVAGEALKSMQNSVKYSDTAVKLGIAGVNQQASTQDELTNSTRNVVTEIEKMRVEMEKIVMDSGALKNFANVLNMVTDSMRDAIAKLGGADGGLAPVGSELGKYGGMAAGGMAGGAAGGLIGRYVGGIGGTILGPAGTFLGMAAGGALGDYLGGKIGEAISGLLGAGKALGGVAAGPTSGYLEKLHGVEAVVPLPDGRSIPVEMGGLTEMVTLMRENIRLAQDMVDTLKSSQDIQDRMLANSY